MIELKPCPKCNDTDVSKVEYTFWGGYFGPKILNHTKCNKCKTTYNGKTGKSNTKNIIFYYGILVAAIIIIMIIINNVGN